MADLVVPRDSKRTGILELMTDVGEANRTRVRIGERSRGAPQNGIDLDGRLLRAKSTSSKKGQS